MHFSFLGIRPYLTQCQHEDTGSTVDQVFCEASEQPLPPLEECNRVACPAQYEEAVCHARSIDRLSQRLSSSGGISARGLSVLPRVME